MLDLQQEISDEVRKDLDKWAEEVVFAAKRNIGATTTKKSYRSKWRRGKPIGSPTIKHFKGKIDSSGELRKSLDHSIDENLNVKFESLYYGRFIDEGRKPGKYPPIDEIKKWMNKKPVRLRDMATGKFTVKTRRTMMTASFLIARKIRYFGIDKTGFYTNAIQQGMDKIE